MIKILGFAGSLRRGSYNRAALRAAVRLAPRGAVLEEFDLQGIPMFNQDLEQALPEPVRVMKDRIRAADAILFVSPEYSFSIPAVLKNAMDWGSRPHGDNSWNDKPAAVMGVSTGMLGTVRMQYHLRQVCLDLNLHLVNRPEVMIGTASEKFDADLALTDQHSRDKIAELLAALADWTLRLRTSGESAV